jgi:hypothetical protein
LVFGTLVAGPGPGPTAGWVGTGPSSSSFVEFTEGGRQVRTSVQGVALSAVGCTLDCR